MPGIAPCAHDWQPKGNRRGTGTGLFEAPQGRIQNQQVSKSNTPYQIRPRACGADRYSTRRNELHFYRRHKEIDSGLQTKVIDSMQHARLTDALFDYKDGIFPPRNGKRIRMVSGDKP